MNTRMLHRQHVHTVRRVIVTFYMSESAWFVALAFVVVSAVIIHEIVTRRRNGRRGDSGTKDRPADGQ
jgi:hypothetical protein